MTELSWSGYYPICANGMKFVPQNAWFWDIPNCEARDCECTLPERASMLATRELSTYFKSLTAIELSPAQHGVSKLLIATVPGYVASQLYPDTAPEALIDGCKCENLETQMVLDNGFELVMTQDVMARA